MSSESTEQLLDAFKAAALSVTKLYKTSAAAETRARANGYQDCLDDLLSFLDKENIGLSDGEGWRIRRWATERLEGRDAVSQGAMESDDEVETTKAPEPSVMSSPEIQRASSVTRASPAAASRNEVHMRDSAPPVMEPVVEVVEEEQQPPIKTEFVVPSQETFTFQAPAHVYPNQESYLNLDNLNLSDNNAHNNSHSSGNSNNSTSTSTTTTTSMPRRRHGNPPRSSSRSAAGHLGRGAGQKRRLNLGEIFDLGSLGYGKDPFGSNGPKRSRHS